MIFSRTSNKAAAAATSKKHNPRVGNLEAAAAFFRLYPSLSV